MQRSIAQSAALSRKLVFLRDAGFGLVSQSVVCCDFRRLLEPTLAKVRAKVGSPHQALLYSPGPFLSQGQARFSDQVS